MFAGMAPFYVNFFMGRLEHDFLQTQPLIPLLWIRFLDDIFTLWPNGETSVNTFLWELNQFLCVQFTSFVSNKTRHTLTWISLWKKIHPYHFRSQYTKLLHIIILALFNFQYLSSPKSYFFISCSQRATLEFYHLCNGCVCRSIQIKQEYLFNMSLPVANPHVCKINVNQWTRVNFY